MLPYSEEKSHKSISTEAATIFSKVEKGRTQLLHLLKSLKIRSVGEKKGGGEDGNIPLLNWVNVFSTVYGDKISICFSLIIFLWQL